MKIIGRNNREIRTLDEYKEYAPPERDYQWAPEHSAMEFAKKVLANKLLEELSLSLTRTLFLNLLILNN